MNIADASMWDFMLAKKVKYEKTFFFHVELEML